MKADLDRARTVVAAVKDPELPELTIADLGILRDVSVDEHGVVVTVTPTFSGCPAIAAINADIVRNLELQGFSGIRIKTSLSPAWSSSWISDEGRRKLSDAGIAPPSEHLGCPQCGSPRTDLLSTYAATPCRSLHRCCDCLEPFDAIKSI